MDIIKTENYYRTLNDDSLCSCDYCRNYYKEVKKAYPLYLLLYRSNNHVTDAKKQCKQRRQDAACPDRTGLLALGNIFQLSIHNFLVPLL